MTYKEFSEKVETVTNNYGQIRAYTYDFGNYRVVGCEETNAHKWQVNLVNFETKKVKCVATRVNRYNVISMMYKYYILTIEERA